MPRPNTVYRPMDTAPRDGQVIRLHMPDGSSFLAKPISGLVDCDGHDCWSWGTASEDQDALAPIDWTDGICWNCNEDGKPSTRPVGWSPAQQAEG